MVRRTLIKDICENQYGTDEPQAGVFGSQYDPLTKRTYFCGYFSAVGYPVGFVAAVDATTGERRDFPKFTHVFANNTVEGVVNKVISDGDGGYYVAGEFTNVVEPGSTYAQVRYNLAKVNSDLTIDQNFVPIVNSKVRDIAYDGTLLYICGDFTLVNGQPRTCFAAINGSTGELDTRAGFNLYVQRFTGGIPTINCMAFVGSQLILAGRFDKVNDTFLDNFARIDTVTPGLDITFTLNTNNEVRYLVAESTRLTYAGTFTQSNSLSRVRIAQADPPYVTPSDITSFDPAPDGTVNNLVSVGGELYVAGEFTTIAGESRPAGIASFVVNAITDLNPDLRTFDGDPIASSHAIYAHDGGVYVAGSFEKVGATERLGLAKVSSLGSLISGFSANIAKLSTYSFFAEEGTVVTGMVGDGDLLLIYGTPHIINSVRRTFIAAFEEDGSLSDYNVEISLNASSVYDVAIDTNGDVYFSMACYEAGVTVNGQERRGGAATDPDGNLLAWNPNVSIFGADVYSLCVRGSFVYIGGFLWEVDGNSNYEYFAATLKSTGALVELADNPAPDGAVQTIAVTDNYIYIGGWFDQVLDNLGNPITVNGFAVLSVGGGAYQTDLGVSGDIGVGDIYVNSIELNQDETLLYMAGYFTTVQGQARQGLFSINTSNVLQSWTSSLFDLGAQTLSISYDQNTIIIGGYSQQAITTIRVAELDLNGSVAGLNALTSRGVHQNIASVEKTRYFVYAFGDVLRIINTELTPIPFPSFFFTDFNVFAGGQVCAQIGTYPVLGALNLSGDRAGSGQFQLLNAGDVGVDSAGVPILGPTGVSGATGLVGGPGAYVYGITGASPRGVTGFLPGATGIRGLTGLRGQTGVIGVTGSSASIGHTGLIGATGLMGFQQTTYVFSEPIILTSANTLVAIDTFDAPVSVTLPTAASVGPGKFYYIYDVGTYPADPGNFLAGRGFSTNAVTLLTTGGDTINGESSLILNAFGEVVIVVSNGIDRYTASIPAARVIGTSLIGMTGLQGITGVQF